KQAAGGVLTAKQAPRRPGTAPAPGLRAGRDVSSWYRRPSEGSNPMRRLKLVRWAAVFALGLALAPSFAAAQEADTLSISGTFRGGGGIVLSSFNGMDIEYPGMLGADLAEVYAHGNAHTWTLTLHGVSYSHDYSYVEWNDERGYGHNEQFITRIHATPFD